MSGSLEKISYTLHLQSYDKLSGSTNNKATFNINWDTFLPRKFDYYKIDFTFKTKGGYYFDTTDGKNHSLASIYADFGSSSFSYNSTTNGFSQLLGFAQRVIETTTEYTATGIVSTKYSTGNYFTAAIGDNVCKVIGRPTQNCLYVTINNQYDGAALTNTDGSGVAQSDMTDWYLQMEFIPIDITTPNPDNRWT